MSAPARLPDRAEGPACEHELAVQLHPLLTRVTAANPSIMTGPGTNTYVFGDDDEVIVIDPGPDEQRHLEVVSSIVGNRRVQAIAVTHHHVDHAPGAWPLAEQWHAPVVAFGHEALAPDVAATEGTVLGAGSVALRAWYTPGHASDHLCFHDERTGWLFSGDHLMEGSTVVLNPPDGDLTEYLASVERVRAADLRTLAPGHGRLLGAPSDVAADVLAHRRARAVVVLEALRDTGPSTATQLRAVAYADVGPERDAVAIATCWAHLRGLVDDGTATSSSERDDPDAVFTAVASPTTND